MCIRDSGERGQAGDHVLLRGAGDHAIIETLAPVSYTHLRAHETRHDLVCRLLLEKKNVHRLWIFLLWKGSKHQSAFVFPHFPLFFFLMIRRPPRSTQSRSSAASDVYKRQISLKPWR